VKTCFSGQKRRLVNKKISISILALMFLAFFSVQNAFSQSEIDHNSHAEVEHADSSMLTSDSTHATEQHAEDTHSEEAFNPADMILHHIADSYGWHLWDYTNKEDVVVPVEIPLPVILFADGNLDVFMSSAFHHGHSTVQKGDRIYSLDHGHIVEESGLHPVDFSITKNVASMLIAAFLLVLIFSAVGRGYKKRGIAAPKGIQALIEPIVVFIKDDIAIPNIGKDKYAKFLPYLLTVFFFIWINNLLGLIPFFPGGANVTGNIAVTLVLAVFTFLMTNINGSKAYWKHVFATPGVPVWLAPIMIPVELIGLLSKPFALMVRLFANITAGHIIILSLISLIFIFKTIAIAPVSVAFSLFMNVLELLVALLQAYIFTLLSALFIGMAVDDGHH
jgi:F-type H+-transporting ATPase subunit a